MLTEKLMSMLDKATLQVMGNGTEEGGGEWEKEGEEENADRFHKANPPMAPQTTAQSKASNPQIHQRTADERTDEVVRIASAGSVNTFELAPKFRYFWFTNNTKSERAKQVKVKDKVGDGVHR